MRNRFIIFTSISIATGTLTGCQTTKSYDGSPTDSLGLGSFVAFSAIAIIVSPVYVASKGWELSRDGMKTHVYASPGTTLGDFQRAIDEAENENCHPELDKGHNHVKCLKYRGKKAVYYGRFRDGLAIRY